MKDSQLLHIEEDLPAGLLRDGDVCPWESQEKETSIECSSNPGTWPRITIVTPSFHQDQYLESTIRSVLNQNYPNLEYIIIDGGSSDRSVEIIKKYEPYLAYWHSKPDKGQSDAINQGFERATGAVMGWLNSDDLLAEAALFHLAAAYQPGLYWWTGGTSRILLDGTVVNYDPQQVQPISRQELLHARVNVNQVSTFWTRELWQQVGSHVLPLHLAMDYELWLRFSQYSAAIPIAETLGIFRNHETAKTGTSDGYEKYLKECDRIRLAEYQKLGLRRWQRSILINFWTRYASAKRHNWRSWIGRRPIPYV